MTGIKEYKWQQRTLGVLITITLGIILFKQWYKQPEPFEEWIFYIAIITLLSICSIGLMIEHKLSSMESQLVEKKLKYGLETGQNLKREAGFYPDRSEDDE